METYFTDHCATCGNVAEREATIIGTRGQWVCDSCGEPTIWDLNVVQRLTD